MKKKNKKQFIENKLNCLILKSTIEHELPFEIDTTSIILSFANALWKNLENAILSNRLAAFDNRRRHSYRDCTI